MSSGIFGGYGAGRRSLFGKLDCSVGLVFLTLTFRTQVVVEISQSLSELVRIV